MVYLSSPSVVAPRTALQNRAKDNAIHDASLIQRFNAGDETAFTEIITRHRAKLFQLALGRLRNSADAEEVVQDVFIRAHRALAAFRGESSLASWLYRITLNLAHNRYWYFHRRHRHLTESLERSVGQSGTATYADFIASDAPGPAREAATNEFAGLAQACINRLAPPQRDILHLRTVQHHSYSSIARKMGIQYGTVKSRIARARAQLRLLMVEAYSDPTSTRSAPCSSWFESFRDPTRLSSAVVAGTRAAL